LALLARLHEDGHAGDDVGASIEA